MSDNGPENLKLRLPNTDTSRFKKENAPGTPPKPSVGSLSAGATVPQSEINDPLAMRTNTGRLKKVSAGETGALSAIAPTPNKHETVKLKIVKNPTAPQPGPATSAPLHLNVGGTVAAPAPEAPAAPATLKMPKLNLRPGGTMAAPPPAPEAPAAVPPPTTPKVPTLTVKLGPKKDAPAPAATIAAPPAEAPAAPAASEPAASSSVSSRTVKLTVKRPGATVAAPAPEEAKPAEPAAEKPAAPALRIRPQGGATAAPAAGGNAGATIKLQPGGNAGATLKLHPITASEPASPTAETVAAPENGAPQLKQTGAKLSLKHKEADDAAKTVALPPPGVPAPGAAADPNAATQPGPPPQEQPAAPAAGKTLVLKKGADKTAAEPGATPAPAAAPEAVRPDFIEGIEDSEPQLGKIEAICAILSFVAASAACYFIVMDFLKYI